MGNNDRNEAWEEKASGRRMRPQIIALWALIALALLGGLFWLFFRRRGGYTEAVIEKSYTVSASSRAGMESFGDGLLRYSSDGISFLDTKGRELWNAGSSMNNPHFVFQGDHGAVADLNGQTVVVFDQDGECGRYKTTDPIIGLAISSEGVTAVAIERDLNSLVCFYDRLGLRLDIEISLEMAVSGYPAAMALSPDGSGLVLSMISSQGGGLNSQLVFYNFTVGRSEANRLVGFFNHEGHLLTQIDYISSKRVAAVSDDRLEIFSLEQENKPELKETVMFPGEIAAYGVGGGHEAFLCPDPGSGDLMLSVYDADGKELFKKTVDNGVRHLLLGESLTLLLTEQGLELWDYAGNSYYSGTLPRQNAALFLQGRQLIQFDGSALIHYSFR